MLQEFRRPLAACAGLLISFALQTAASGDEAAKTHEFADYLLIPVRVHLLSASDSPQVTTTLADQDIDRILTKVNAVWSQAGIHFWLESLIREEATNTAGFAEGEELRFGSRLLGLRPEASKSDQMLHLYYLKEFAANGIRFPEAMFVKDTASLREVAGGIDEPLPRVSSHEIGHSLGLPHRQDTFNLMASGTTGTSLNAAEIDHARAEANKLVWVRAASGVLAAADEAWDTADRGAARKFYAQLITLPLKCGAIDRAKARLNAD